MACVASNLVAQRGRSIVHAVGIEFVFGILNVNKPVGWTSRDVVNRVQRLVRPAKVGHAGTLDPLATGVLVVCIGPATRLIEYVQKMPKRYVADFRLGVTSPSDDTELELTALENPTIPSLAQLEGATPKFIGRIEQRPPDYSAIKVKGQRAYDLARQGKQLDLPARPVHVHSIDIITYEYPKLVLDITCGSGTYIRCIGRDLATSVGSGAVMSGLERTSIGDFTLSNACTPEQVMQHGVDSHLESAIQAVVKLPRVQLSQADLVEINHGRNIEIDGASGDELAATDPGGKLAALLVPRDGKLWRPRMVFREREL